MVSFSGDTVEAELRVGTLDFALAKLISNQQHTIEFPTILLPADVVAGSIIKLTCSKAVEAEKSDEAEFTRVQELIKQRYGSTLPEAPSLRALNVTQTSVVLEWNPIDIASADFRSLELFRNDQRIGKIPDALHRTATKVSNLDVDSPYIFTLVLSTSAGRFISDELKIKTHKMSDLSGVVVAIGSLAQSQYSEDSIKTVLKQLNCGPPQEKVNLKTTHFICSAEGGSEFEHANKLNIPIVRPEWLQACLAKRELVGVREYYLTVDPKTLPQIPITEQPQTNEPEQEAEHEPEQEAEHEPEHEPEPEAEHEAEHEVEGEPEEEQRELSEPAEQHEPEPESTQDEAPLYGHSEASVEPNDLSEPATIGSEFPASQTEQTNDITPPASIHEDIPKREAETEELIEEEVEEPEIESEKELQEQLEEIDINSEQPIESSVVDETSLSNQQAEQILENAQATIAAEIEHEIGLEKVNATKAEELEESKETEEPEEIKNSANEAKESNTDEAEDDESVEPPHDYESDLARILKNDSKVELRDSEEQHVQINTVVPVEAHSADLTTTEKEGSMQDVPL